MTPAATHPRTPAALVRGRGRAVAAVLVLLAIGVAVVTRWDPVVAVDHDVAAPAFALTAARPWLARLALDVQLAFSTTPTVLATLLAGLVLVLRRHPRQATAVVAVMATTSLVTTAVKLAVDRPRPRWSDPLTTLASPSFPSGHASSTTAAATLAVLLAGALLGAERARRAVLVAAVVVVLAVGADRLLLGVHYLSDVVAGALLGALVAVALWRLVGAGPASSPSPCGPRGSG